jgi:uncharacterized Fe-S cluster-containing radical SAM superfamily protein
MLLDQKPFDPITLSSTLREIICKNSSMKYTEFVRCGPYGGMSTAFSTGCCLRCIFCWVDQSRDEPEKFGRFYSPDAAFEELLKNANIKGVKRLRLSGGEPTICPDHLFRILDLIHEMDAIITVETNGIVFGADEDYVEKLMKYKQLHVRVSLKAGTPEAFERITGASAQFFELPFNAINFLKKYRISSHVASMADPKLMTADEHVAMLEKLKEVGYTEAVEEETCDPYPQAMQRLKEAGLNIFSEE